MSQIKNYIIGLEEDAAHTTQELLEGLGRFINEATISHPFNRVIFEPGCFSEIPHEMETMVVHVDSSEFPDFAIQFEVMMHKPALYLNSPRIRNAAGKFHCAHKRMRIVIRESNAVNHGQVKLELQFKVPLEGMTTSDLKAHLQDFIDLYGEWSRMFDELEDAACREKQRRLAAIEVKKRESKCTSTAMAELESLIGLAPVKAMVKQLISAQNNMALRQIAGLKTTQVSPHLVFSGNPGTGKTTVARLVGRIYKDLGLLSTGHVVEVERSSLVAEYIGQTAVKTQKKCEEALGGILFIDEAYSLSVQQGRDFGCEAIQTLLTFMENNRGKMAVIVAGYPQEMTQFLASNPGLRSRFDTEMYFPDYRPSEMEQIFHGMVESGDYVLDGSARILLQEVLATLSSKPGFANARDVRTLFQNVTLNQAARCDRSGFTAKTQLSRIIGADFRPLRSVSKSGATKSKPVDLVRFGYL